MMTEVRFSREKNHWLKPGLPLGGIVLIYLIGVFGMLVVSSAVPALSGISAEFHPPSHATIGWVMSMPALAAAVSSLCVGWLVDRFGDRPMMVAGVALVIVGDVGVITAHGIEQLLAWRVVGGLGYVCMVVGAVTMMARITTGRQGTAALALWSTVIPASFIIASFYGVVTGGRIDWRSIFVGHAIGSGALAVAAHLFLPASVPAASSRLKGLREVVRTPWPFILGLSFAVAAFAAAGVGLVLSPVGLAPAMAMNCVLMAGLGVLVGMWSLLPQVAPSPASMGATCGLITQVTLLGVLFGPPAAFGLRFVVPHGSLIFLGIGAVLSLVAWPIWMRKSSSGEAVAH